MKTKGITMTILNYIQENNIDLATKLDFGKPLYFEFKINIDDTYFDIKLLIESKGRIDIQVKTPISSFSRSFSYEFNILSLCNDEDSFDFNVRTDFSNNINTGLLTDILSISKFNIMMAELFLHIENNHNILMALKDNSVAYYNEINRRREEKEKKEKEDIQIRKDNFDLNHNFLTIPEIKKEIKRIKDDGIDGNIFGFNLKKYPYSLFKAVDRKYNEIFILVYINDDNKIHMTKSNDGPNFNVNPNFQKTTIKNIQAELEKAYKIIECPDVLDNTVFDKNHYYS